jgi:hypothetical protein
VGCLILTACSCPPLCPQTDEVKGTGVWGVFQLKREDDEKKDEKKERNSQAK